MELVFPSLVPHAWSYKEANGIETRTCTICGQHEELDLGCGFAGEMWMTERNGDRAKHPAA